jgi:hypothetical protein
MLEVDFNGRQEEYVLKIPAHGTPEKWQEAEGNTLHYEANLMDCVRRNTYIPVLEVVIYENTI